MDPFNRKKLSGQSALVTGANSGIGRAVAFALAAEGASVAINYVTDDQATQDMIRQIQASGGKAIGLKGDVSQEGDVQQMFRDLIAAFGTIDILVNNAGIQRDAPLHTMALKDWQRVIDVNLTGQFLCSREAAREFLRRGLVPERSRSAGKIICMSSVHEVIPWSGHVNYASSKGGVMLLMKSMAQELAPFKIRVNSIGPGAIQTPINKPAWDTPQALDKLLTLIPYGRIGEPEDVGRLAAWLASDDSEYITGTTIFIDGGMTLFPGFATNG